MGLGCHDYFLSKVLLMEKYQGIYGLHERPSQEDASGAPRSLQGKQSILDTSKNGPLLTIWGTQHLKMWAQVTVAAMSLL